MHSLPFNFITDPLLLRQTPADSDYATMRRKLRSALYMPSHKRWIADWLFVGSQTCFHPNIILPPESFRNSVAIRTQHSSKTHKPPPVLPEIFQRLRPHHLVSSKPADISSPVNCDMLYVPVANINFYTVGYCFMTGATPASSGDTTELSPVHFFARFAYDASRHDILITVTSPTASDGSNGRTVLLRSGPSDDGGRDFAAFSCNNDNFSFENLPNTAVSMTFATPDMSGEDTPDASRPPPPARSATNSQLSSRNPIVRVGSCESSSALVLDNLDVTDEWLNSQQVIDVSPVSPVASKTSGADWSRMPWIVNDSGSTMDSVGIPRCPGKMGTSAGAFYSDHLRKSLIGIQQMLAGSIQCCMYEKTFDSAPQLLPKECVNRFKASFMASQEGHTSMLQELAIQEYYSAILHVPTKEHLLAPPIDSDEPSSSVAGRATTPPTKRRRKKCDKWEATNGVPLSRAEAQLLEERKEAQRRRNRVSAARSYERKKRLRLQQQASELSNAT